MSPRGSSSTSTSSSGNLTTRSAATPYARRPAGQPKSSRQQFSACGACRMRRVRCDLKDVPFTSTGSHPACSNCKERGLKCVDEFADVKAVKLLRRGRRLQQVEAIYGKVVGPDGGSSSSSSSPPTTRLPTMIPQLKTEFFASPFWHWFSIQRPVLDPDEFPARFSAHAKGTHSLGHEGGLLAMILVVWAASFGVDEYGVADTEDCEFAESDKSPSPAGSVSVSANGSLKRDSVRLPAERKHKEVSVERQRRDRKEKTDAMLREVLELIDFHGVMRRPTWDGVRALLLILPLMEEAHPLERLAMYEATLSQTQALCTLASSPLGPTTNAFSYAADDAVIRARIFWYAYMQEGISTGMRGGRLVLHNDDLEAFQCTLPPFGFDVTVPSSASPPFSSASAVSTHQLVHSQHVKSQRTSPSRSYLQTTQLFAIPLHLSAVCRKVHMVLTGPKATRRAEDHGLIDAHGMREIWEELNQCWQEFDVMRRDLGDHNALEIEQFVSGWQIFIFECHNIIREALKQSMANSPTNDNSVQNMFSASSPSRPSSSHSSNSSPYLSPQYLHNIATRECRGLLPYILRIIKFHLSQEDHGISEAGLFKSDTGLVRDGCFFAGFLAASLEGDSIDLPSDHQGFKQEDCDSIRNRIGVEEGVALCLRALSEMRWAFSKSEEREETVRLVWETRKTRRPGRFSAPHRQDLEYNHSNGYHDHLSDTYGKSMHTNSHMGPHTVLPMHGLNHRPLLPPLSLLGSPRRAGSVPNTACSTDGHGANGWPSYTPPGTATSVTTSAGTGVSARGSPVFASMVGPMPYKGDPHETFYHVTNDLDQFSFSAPIPGSNVSDPSTMATYSHRNPSVQSMHSGPATTYLDPGVFGATSASDINACPQFGDDCNNGFYH